MLEELLYDVVAEDILHELECIGLNFSENLVLLVTVGSLKFFLNKPRAMLVPTKLHDMIVDILDNR